MNTNRTMFSKLFKYSSAADKNETLENYFTEAFAIILEDRLLAKKLLKYFLNVSVGNYLDIKTQRSISSGDERSQIDLRIEASNTIIYLENKINSSVDCGQLKKYLNALDSETQPKRVLWLITKDEFNDHSNITKRKEFNHTRWYEIYDFIKKHVPKTKDTIRRFVLENLKDFMEAYKMDAFSGFKKNELCKLWPDFITFRERKISRFEEEIKKHLKEEGYLIDPAPEKTHYKWSYFYFYRSKIGNNANIEKNILYKGGIDTFFNLDIDESQNGTMETYISVGIDWWRSKYKNRINESDAIKTARTKLKRKWGKEDYYSENYLIERRKPLSVLLNNTPQDAQIKKVLVFINQTLKNIENDVPLSITKTRLYMP